MRLFEDLSLWPLVVYQGVVNRLPGWNNDNLTVSIQGGTVQGRSNNGVDTFSGIPYAQSPVGNLRLRPPQRITHELGTIDGTGHAMACPQQQPREQDFPGIMDLLSFVGDSGVTVPAPTDQSEDCLTVTVTRPSGTTSQDRLPVLFYIYGGGFEIGCTEDNDPADFVRYGIDIGKPFIFVAVNYRINGFGFLPGQRVAEEGVANLGLLDQRLGLEWTADNIASFGGDPTKVTIWGISAGSISVFDQMALNNGNHSHSLTGRPLFRAAIMSSGSMTPAESVSSEKAERVYQRVVEAAGCSEAENSLQCLREVDYETFHHAVSTLPGPLSYNGLALSYLPRPDGKTLRESPEILAREGRYAAVPMIVGTMEDEGTLISILQRNLTTTEHLADYLQGCFFAEGNQDQMSELVHTYGQGEACVENGSPFGTGLANEVFPGFKERSAVIGDVIFILMRRLFLTYSSTAHPDVPSWSYMGSFNKGAPVFGTTHGSDTAPFFNGNGTVYAAETFRRNFINFVYSLDPNESDDHQSWPRWASSQEQLRVFASETSLIVDRYRSRAFDWIADNVGILHV
ncbi:Alpha/Beta hydrolase protein [Aspergillus pseudodeflectus]|uniref:Carboxylic ester hydrolase n=1 Tax=Aspergillus pseudodeflectus TaxID=176178 RepID=A0ABR4JKQ7_9EURO